MVCLHEYQQIHLFTASSPLNTRQRFGVSWLVTIVKTSHSCRHFFLSDSRYLPQENPPCVPALILSRCLNWSSKLHGEMRCEVWSIGHTWERLSLFLCYLLDTDWLKTDKYPCSEGFFSFLVPYLSRSVLSGVPVPVSTPPPLLSFYCISFLSLFLSDKPRLKGTYKHYTEAALWAFSRFFKNSVRNKENFPKINKSR